MYRIVLCEDEPAMAAHLEGLVRVILEEESIPCHLDVVDSASRLLELLRAPGYDCHLVLTDILLGGLSGMQAARQLRVSGHSATIVFVTVSEGFAVEGYEVGAAGYLLKPVEKERLRQLLLRVYNQNVAQRYLVLDQRTRSLRLAVADITYLEIAHRRLAIHCKDGVLLHTAKLDELEQALSAQRFVRCHKSYLANLDNAKQVRRYRLTVVTGEEVPISKVHYDEVKRRFTGSLAAAVC